MAPDVSWYVADGSGPTRRYGICHHEAQPFQFLNAVEKTFFGRHLRGYSQGVLLRFC